MDIRTAVFVGLEVMPYGMTQSKVTLVVKTVQVGLIPWKAVLHVLLVQQALTHTETIPQRALHVQGDPTLHSLGPLHAMLVLLVHIHLSWEPPVTLRVWIAALAHIPVLFNLICVLTALLEHILSMATLVV